MKQAGQSDSPEAPQMGFSLRDPIKLRGRQNAVNVWTI
jgi:adenylate cyclase